MAISSLVPLVVPPTQATPAAQWPDEADAFVTDQYRWSMEFNASTIPQINEAVTDVNGAVANSSDYAAAALAAAGQAQARATEAEAARDAAQGSEFQAQTYAALAGVAAGLPSLAGNGGKALFAKLDEQGTFWGDPSQAIGDVLVSTRIPGLQYQPMDGTLRLQASYPELYGIIGHRFNGPYLQVLNRTLPSSSAWTYAMHAYGMFFVFAVGAANYATSPDGITWTARTLPAGAAPSGVDLADGKIIAMPNGTDGFISDDGINWTGVSLPVSKSWNSTVFGNGLYLAVNGTSTTPATYATSPDGINWTARNFPLATSYHVAFGSGKFLAIRSNDGSVVTSNDGIDWTSVGTVGVGVRRVRFLDGRFWAIADASSNILYSSADGASWMSHTLPSPQQWRDISFGNGILLVVASGAAISAQSTDGTVFTSIAMPASGDYHASVYAAGAFVVPRRSSAFVVTIAGSYDTNTQFPLPLWQPAPLLPAYIKARNSI